MLSELLDLLRQNKRPEREKIVRLGRLRAIEYKDLLYSYEYYLVSYAFDAIKEAAG